MCSIPICYLRDYCYCYMLFLYAYATSKSQEPKERDNSIIFHHIPPYQKRDIRMSQRYTPEGGLYPPPNGDAYAYSR